MDLRTELAKLDELLTELVELTKVAEPRFGASRVCGDSRVRGATRVSRGSNPSLAGLAELAEFAELRIRVCDELDQPNWQSWTRYRSFESELATD